MSDNNGGGLLAFAREHPVGLTVAVVAVAGLAWLASRKKASASPASTAPTTSTVDPNMIAYATAQGANATAIQTANITAGAQNLGVLAQLISATEGTKASESAALASSANATAAQEYGQQVAGVSALNQIRAALAATLGTTAAARDTSLASTAAQKETALAATRAQVTENAQTQGAQVAIANVNATTQQAAIAANLAAEKAAQQTQLQLGQYQKDIARAKDNTNIVGSIIGGIAHIFGL